MSAAPDDSATQVPDDDWDPWEDWDAWDEAYGGSGPRLGRFLQRGAPQPRWTPDRPLAERITRRGRWQDVDPLQQGRLWNLWEWAAFGFWATLLTGAFAVAWRRRRDA